MLKIMQIHRYIAGLELGSESKSSKSLSGGGCFVTLQGINISHLRKRKIIFKMPFLGDMLVPGGYSLVDDLMTN